MKKKTKQLIYKGEEIEGLTISKQGVIYRASGKPYVVKDGKIRFNYKGKKRSVKIAWAVAENFGGIDTLPKRGKWQEARYLDGRVFEGYAINKDGQVINYNTGELKVSHDNDTRIRIKEEWVYIKELIRGSFGEEWYKKYKKKRLLKKDTTESRRINMEKFIQNNL